MENVSVSSRTQRCNRASKYLAKLAITNALKQSINWRILSRPPARERPGFVYIYPSCVKLKILDSGTPPSCDGHQAARKRPAADSAAALTALTPLKRQVLEASSIEIRMGNKIGIRLNCMKCKVGMNNIRSRMRTKNIRSRMRTKNIRSRMRTKNTRSRMQAKNIRSRIQTKNTRSRMQAKNIRSRIQTKNTRSRMRTKNIRSRMRTKNIRSRMRTKNMRSRMRTKNIRSRMRTKNTRSRMQAKNIRSRMQTKNTRTRMRTKNIRSRMQMKNTRSRMRTKNIRSRTQTKNTRSRMRTKNMNESRMRTKNMRSRMRTKNMRSRMRTKNMRSRMRTKNMRSISARARQCQPSLAYRICPMTNPSPILVCLCSSESSLPVAETNSIEINHDVDDSSSIVTCLASPATEEPSALLKLSDIISKLTKSASEHSEDSGASTPTNSDDEETCYRELGRTFVQNMVAAEFPCLGLKATMDKLAFTFMEAQEQFAALSRIKFEDCLTEAYGPRREGAASTVTVRYLPFPRSIPQQDIDNDDNNDRNNNCEAVNEYEVDDKARLEATCDTICIDVDGFSVLETELNNNADETDNIQPDAEAEVAETESREDLVLNTSMKSETTMPMDCDSSADDLGCIGLQANTQMDDEGVAMLEAANADKNRICAFTQRLLHCQIPANYSGNNGVSFACLHCSFRDGVHANGAESAARHCGLDRPGHYCLPVPNVTNMVWIGLQCVR
uniref:Reverse transcriptase domain-containing protein n=1 Tax=Macrostomum lignano TaxID=282301 RepID=A0A1I8H1J3_9PLAT